MINLKTFFSDEKINLALLNRRERDFTPIIKQIKALYLLRKQLLVKMENLQAEINRYAHQYQTLSDNKVVDQEIIDKKEINQSLKATLKRTEKDLYELTVTLPNVPHPSVCLGNSAKDNKVIKTVMEQNKKKLTAAHWEIAQDLQWLETIKAVEMSQPRSVIYQNEGAKALRILQHFCLDQHTKKGYQELIVPQMVKEEALWGTGQFPKMKADCYQIADHDLFLLPTSEVALVNFYRNKILDEKDLPIKLCASSLCFRRESGAAGKETRGIIRLHQFHKVELVKITNIANSDQELITMLQDSESILQMLKIPYRVVELCTGDLGFSSAKTYDLEIWMPSQQKYVEVASISNTGNFQATSLQIRFQDQSGKKQFVHTLNGSALALDRLLACLLEHYYDVQRQVFIWPEVLKKYLF